MRRALTFLVAFCLAATCVCFSSPRAVAEDRINLIIFGKQVYPDVPPLIINGRTMVPLRFVAEALNLDVSWDDTTQSVVISPKEQDLTIYLNGSASFISETTAAVRLLETKAPAWGLAVEKTFRFIWEKPHPDTSVIAWVNPTDPTVCYFNSRAKAISTTRRAAAICHEATHAIIDNTPLAQVLRPNDAEVFAYYATYCAARDIGDPYAAQEALYGVLVNLPRPDR